ncbi:leucine-rich repeat domain-containing protein [Aggregatimonas sangjinii]|uniref:Leucine-rich repeat domain-containing protein n=1 Tax=Aggregatimonas sangjinii TaxID=2583587 RepID=A0A5B7SSE1_9FLAO|nr:leucine-rich repeat domain-containing protein [Aggregatimonas sangjinii]QCX01705.1 leucine-rich repeat domain-containing protein [Aggregatimonas sangjinii]
MKSRKRHFKNVSPKTLLCILFVGLLFTNCEKDELVNEEAEEVTTTALKWRNKNKIKICHTGRYGHCRIIKIPKWAWRWHKKHGDVRLDDQDGDGFVPDNACGYGQMGDCDDKDPNVNPDIPGSCGDAVDSDSDGIADSEDECPEVAGLTSLNGCPDADGDGIADKDDECPNEAGPPDNDGCPYPDSDGDGVLDKDDECPDEAGTADNNGCPIIELSDYEVLRLVYEMNPGNSLGWDLSNTSMDDWEGVLLDSKGDVVDVRFLNGTGINILPPEIGMLKNIQVLICVCEDLKVIPSEIGQLEKLLAFSVTESKIEGLPASLNLLTQLNVLSIFNNNQFVRLPAGIGNLTNLEALNLSGNSLTEIPAELANLTQLEILSLENNPVTHIPQAVCDLADADTEVRLDADDVCQ